MSGELCRATWAAAGVHQRARTLDEAFPECFCESWSLVAEAESPVGGDERLARILTTPGSYDAGELLTQKLTAAWAGGVSVIRSGASDAEIRGTVEQLLNNIQDPQSLLGAVVFTGSEVSTLGAPERHFGAYHTPAPNKTHHADILATVPAGSKSQQKRSETLRRRDLRDLLQPKIIFEPDVDGLIEKLRLEGL